MPEPQPALSVVRPGEEPERDRGVRRLGRSFWLVALLLAVAAGALVLQGSRLRQLEGSVAGLEARLFTERGARTALEGQISQVRSQMGGVRTALSGLQEELSRLDALVEPDVAPPEPAPDAP